MGLGGGARLFATFLRWVLFFNFSIHMNIGYFSLFHAAAHDHGALQGVHHADVQRRTAVVEKYTPGSGQNLRAGMTADLTLETPD